MSDPYDYLPPGLREKVENRDRRPGYSRRRGGQRWARGTDEAQEERGVKPWTRDYSDQWVCHDCHTYWDCDHASDVTALVKCSKCGLGKECVKCEHYQPKKSTAPLHRSCVPLIWRDVGRWLCVTCRPEHEPSTRPGKKVMVCEKCRDVPQECAFYYPEPFRPRC